MPGLDDASELLVTQLAVPPVAGNAYIAPFWFLGIADDGFSTSSVYPDENVSPAVQLQRWQPTTTQVLMVGISDDYMQPNPLPDDENPAILLQRWQPTVTQVAILGTSDDYTPANVSEENQNPALLLQRWQPTITQVMVLGISDDYDPTPPIDDYMTVEVVNDFDPDPMASIFRTIGSSELTEFFSVLIVTPPPAGSAAGFRVLLRGLGLSPVQGALADLAASGIVYALVQFDRSYPLGGYPLSPKALGFTTRALTFLPTASTVERAQGYFPVYDMVNQKVRLFRDLGAGRWVEPFPGTNLSHISMDVAIVGY